VLLVVTGAGTGWLYLLRDRHVLRSGPLVHGALPLQQLAGGDAQPLIRMVVAWLPAGIAAGVALGALTRLPRALRAAATAIAGAVLLLAASAISDSIAQNDAVSGHVSAAFSNQAVWVAVVLLAAGALIAPPWARGPGAVAAASRS
jgi:hypothetical protein